MVKTLDYTVVFDVSQHARPDDGVAGLLVALALAGAGLLLFLFRAQLPLILRHWFPLVFLVGGVFGSVAFFFRTALQPSQLAAALREGRCQVVEGIVTEFHTMPAREHALESFTVAGKHFDYSDYRMTAGFHRSNVHGGPIREGIQVRISYLGNDIAKLEIANAPTI